MLVSVSRRLAYLAMPKTGTQSLERVLTPLCDIRYGGLPRVKHMTLQTFERFVRPFDLSRAPLLRVAVIETGATVHRLIVDMHHIVSDGISVGIMLDELLALYQGRALEAVRARPPSWRAERQLVGDRVQVPSDAVAQDRFLGM